MSVPLAPKQAKDVAAPPTRKREVSRREVVGILGVVLGSIVLFPVLKWLSGGSDVEPTNLAEISPRELAIAQELWQKNGHKDYDIDLVVDSPAHKTNLHLEVRGGVGKRLVKNDIESTRADDLSQWTIDGQMTQIAEYIARDTSKEARNAGKAMVNVGRFDPKLGYPLEYSRQGIGDQTKFHVTVLKFEAVTP